MGGLAGGSSPSVALGEDFPECNWAFPECNWHLGKPLAAVVLTPAYPGIRLDTCLLLYFIAYYFYYACTTLMRGGKLVLSGLWGECCVCDLGAWRVRVVSTKLEYTTSLGQVLRGVLPGHPWNGYLWWVNGI